MDIKELPEQIDTSTYSKFLNALFSKKIKLVERILLIHFFFLFWGVNRSDFILENLLSKYDKLIKIVSSLHCSCYVHFYFLLS